MYKKLFKHKQTEKEVRKDYGHVIKSAVVSAIITLVMAIVIAYFVLPAATIRSGVTVIYAVIMSGVFVALFSFIHCINEGTYSGDKIRAKVKLFWLIPAIALIMAASSLTCFHAAKANSVAKITISETSITESFPDLTETKNHENLALIDLDSAKMLGDKKIAALEHASWYEVDHDEWNLIQHDGKYYRLAFLDYGGFWKHHKAHVDGIPGYILVECTPDGGVVTQNATLVELEEPIRYSEGAYWSHDLERHLRSQYPSYIFDKSFAEIDNDGTPYYVTGVLRPQSGVWGIKTIESFILTSAQTGESTEYTIDNAPAWIDHVFSLDYLTRIAEWHYAYRDGFLNSLFSKTNVWHTSYHYRDDRSDKEEDGEFANFYGYSSVTLNGDVQFYTGLTAANNADSNLGWLFMDASTGQMTEYSVIGAEESSAQKAIEQLVSAYRYQATFPLPANIAGEASYVMCLKGNAGLVQAYAICNVENYSIAVQAETLPAAIDLYLAKLGKENLSTSTPDKPTETKVNSTSGPLDFSDVVNITSVEINGTAQYYYETADGNVYVVVQIK